MEQPKKKENKRKSGILLHITSLPGKYGIGTLGEEAYRFVDFLYETKQTYWQILPLGHTGYGDSPYSSYSAFAGNPLLIDFDSLPFNDDKPNTQKLEEVDFNKVKEKNFPKLNKTAKNFINSETDKSDYNRFCEENKYWLHDYAFFTALKYKYEEEPVWTFDKKIHFRDLPTLIEYEDLLKEEIEINKVIQFFFFEQWFRLKNYANQKDIQIVGDIPLYVAGDSSDVWVNPEIFMLNENLAPRFVAGVPPDYFSVTGQLWGNPVYDWDNNKKTNYTWWKERIKMNLSLFDVVRIDHFRGFSEFWAVPFGNETAEHGNWLVGPEKSFLDEIFKERERIIAEDLGLLSNGVINLLESYKLPGMKILQFAFDSDSENPFLPHNYTENCVVYTGTHDNDTCNGILEDYTDKETEFMKSYLNYDSGNYAHTLIRNAWASVAETAIAPLQDLLELGKEGRMNTPGTLGNNWKWRFRFEDIKQDHKDFLVKMTEIYGRVK